MVRGRTCARPRAPADKAAYAAFPSTLRRRFANQAIPRPPTSSERIQYTAPPFGCAVYRKWNALAAAFTGVQNRAARAARSFRIVRGRKRPLLRDADDFLEGRPALAHLHETLRAERAEAAVLSRARQERVLGRAREHLLAQRGRHAHHLVDADASGEARAAALRTSGAAPQR